MNMHVCVALFEIQIPHAQSLKEKRRVVQSLKSRLRGRLEVSAAEVGLQELHQRARIAVSCVSGDRKQAQRLMADVLRVVETENDAALTGWTEEWLDFDADTELDVPNVMGLAGLKDEEEP